MRCEVVAIGTEMLLGQIVDTNSSWIGEQLALASIDSHFQVKVGDNFERMAASIRQALKRSDAVICCGGLGPTQDDITREVIAHVMGVELRRDEAIVDKIRDMFESRGRTMADNNRRQAGIPVGATPIAQMPGTAPGLVCPIGDKVVYAVPGVPREMREMMQGTILPDLQRRSGRISVIRSRVLRSWGHSESGLAEILAARIEALDDIGNPTLAFLASGIEGIKIRITAKSDDEAAALTILDAEETLIRGLLGDVIFGVDDESMEVVILNKLREQGLTLAAAEALTGGVLASRMSDVDRGMAVFRGAVIAPRHDDRDDSPGADHAAAAAILAQSVYKADVGIAAIRANDDENQPRNTVFLCVAIGDDHHLQTIALPGDHYRLRNYAVIGLLNFLRKILDGL